MGHRARVRAIVEAIGGRYLPSTGMRQLESFLLEIQGSDRYSIGSLAGK